MIEVHIVEGRDEGHKVDHGIHSFVTLPRVDEYVRLPGDEIWVHEVRCVVHILETDQLPRVQITVVIAGNMAGL